MPASAAASRISSGSPSVASSLMMFIISSNRGSEIFTGCSSPSIMTAVLISSPEPFSFVTGTASSSTLPSESLLRGACPHPGLLGAGCWRHGGRSTSFSAIVMYRFILGEPERLVGYADCHGPTEPLRSCFRYSPVGCVAMARVTTPCAM